MRRLDAWFDEDPSHTVANLAKACRVSRQAIYNGLEREHWGRALTIAISRITGIPLDEKEQERIERYADASLKHWYDLVA